MSLPPIVSPSFARNLGDAVVCDVRWSLAGGARRDLYEAGHVPGAVFVDLDRDLSSAPGPGSGRHPLPEPGDFAAAMSRLGIGDGSTVVAYDDGGGGVAARLVWMLRALGEEAALLDGGPEAWDGPLETGSVDRQPADFTVRPWPQDRLADADLVDRLRDEASAVLIDVRDEERYRGEHEPVDATAGHIPGARNAPWRGNLTPTGRFLAPDELRRRYARFDVESKETIVHCGSGVTACHTALALEAAGLPAPRVYVGSWSGWSTSDRPVATGPE